MDTAGYTIDIAESLAQARDLFQQRKPDVMIVDVMLPDGNGVELIEELNDQSVKTIVITGHPTLKIAIKALKTQVFDFIEKPVQLETIRNTIARALQSKSQGQAVTVDNKTEKEVLQELIVSSRLMERLKKTIAGVAKTSANILITGESGVGKELVARHIHAQSGLTGKFIAVNCGSITQDSALRNFFGQQTVSANNVKQTQAGYLEQASGGTLLLDEITEMPTDAQVHLLRVLETSHFRRLDGNEDVQANFRVLAATNKDLKAAIANGDLRDDLYYRLAEITIEVPALRQRENDLLLITEQILKSLNQQYNQSKQISHSAKERLKDHDWPGNVRELRNVLHQSYLLCGSVINSGDVIINQHSDQIQTQSPGQLTNLLGKTFWEVEKELIFATLEQQQGDKEKTAELLGISLKTLYNRLHAYS